MPWDNAATGYDHAYDLDIQIGIGLTTSSPSGTIQSYTHAEPQSTYTPQSPEYAYEPEVSPSGDEEYEPPKVKTSHKAYTCPFCKEFDIPDGASRISDLRRHFRTKHYSNAQWSCKAGSCEMVFDWQSAYERHLKKHHPLTNKDFLLSSGEVREETSQQRVFACGFETCRKVFETPPGSKSAKRTYITYFHHVANHLQYGATTNEWSYSRRIRNLLHQSEVANGWKTLKPRYGLSPLRWNPHNSASLRRKLECKDKSDIKSIVDLAVSLGSSPFKSADSPSRVTLLHDFNTAPLEPVGHSWTRQQTPGTRSEHSGTPKSHISSSLHGTQTPPARVPGPHQVPTLHSSASMDVIGANSTSHHMPYRRIQTTPAIPPTQMPSTTTTAAAAAAATTSAAGGGPSFGWTQPTYHFNHIEQMSQFPAAPANMLGGMSHQTGAGGVNTYPGHQSHKSSR